MDGSETEGQTQLSDDVALSITRQLVLDNAGQFVRAIEARTSLAAAEVVQTIRGLLVRGVGASARAVERRPAITSLPVTAERLERYLPLWRSILPGHAELRGVISLLLERRHGEFTERPGLAEALGLNDSEVIRARSEFAGDARQFALPGAELEHTPEDDRRKLEGAVEREIRLLTLDKGEVLARQGDEPHALYVVISGRLQVSAPDERGVERRLAEIGSGATAGETEVLTNEPWPATIRALRDTIVVELDSDACQRLIQRYPRFLMAATNVVIRRLKDYSEAARGSNVLPPRTIAVLPVDGSVPAREFAATLTEALGRHGPARHITRHLAEEALEEEALVADTYDDRLVSWLNEQEARFPFVVYEAEPEANAWTRRCLRQADRVMLLARARGNPALSPVEAELAAAGKDGDLHENVELILLHENSDALPTGTMLWLSAREVRDHHHVRLQNPDDFGHLVRRLTGQAVGLVLGGGGARAQSAIGAIKAIREAGIPIDIVGGTSAGSFFAAACALGWDEERMLEVVREFMSTRRQTLDYTLPLVSIMSAGKMKRTLETLFGDVLIEDLWRPYFCVTSNLTRAEMMVHRSGLLRHYVRASCSLPTVFPPVLEGQDLLVDGMLLNNLPVDVVADISQGGPTIAIDVSAKEDTIRDFNFGDSLSASQVLLGKLPLHRDRRIQAPSILDVIIRTSEVASIYARKMQAKRATVYVAPPVSQFGVFERNRLGELVDLGYKSTREALDDWYEHSEEARSYFGSTAPC